MIDPPSLEQAVARHTAVVRIKVPREQIREAMGAAIGEVYAMLKARGIAQAGPLFSYHFRMDPGVFDLEVGVPVAEPFVPAGGRVVASELRARRVVRTVYHGPYEGLGSGWGELMAWMEANGHAPDVDLWECYVAGPESGSDASRWRTELNRPVRT